MKQRFFSILLLSIVFALFIAPSSYCRPTPGETIVSDNSPDFQIISKSQKLSFSLDKNDRLITRLTVDLTIKSTNNYDTYRNTISFDSYSRVENIYTALEKGKRSYSQLFLITNQMVSFTPI